MRGRMKDSIASTERNEITTSQARRPATSLWLGLVLFVRRRLKSDSMPFAREKKMSYEIRERLEGRGTFTGGTGKGRNAKQAEEEGKQLRRRTKGRKQTKKKNSPKRRNFNNCVLLFHVPSGMRRGEVATLMLRER